MPKPLRLPEEIGPTGEAAASASSSDPALRKLRYVIGAVNDEALRAWTDLWEQLRDGVTPAGAVLPDMERGFTPPRGWADFLETFWLLKHYLDYIHRTCEATALPSQGEKVHESTPI